MAPFLSLIIPAYNEERRLPDTLSTVQQYLATQSYAAEVLVVDNGSQDRTSQVVQAFAQEGANLRLLREDQRGKGLAVRRGMQEATGEYRFICDADLSMPIDELSRFLPPELNQFDIAIASREVPGAVRYGEPAYRHWIGRVFNTLVRLLALPDFQDTQCGFKCFTAAAAGPLFQQQRLDGWSFDVEVLFLAVKQGYRVVEVPISWYYNRGSRVSLFSDSWHMFTDVLRIRRNWRRGVYR